MATGGGSPGRPQTVPLNSASTTKEPFDSNSDEFEHLRQQRSPEKQTRMPTFKEFGETIKGLRDENFQLKVRIYLLEKDGKTLNGQSGIHNISEGPPSAVQVELMREFQNLKQSNETLQLKISDSDNRCRHMAQQLEDSLRDKEDLINTNEILMEKLNVFDREVALLKLKKDEDDEIEKCVRAFHGDSDFGSTCVRVPTSTEMELLEAQTQLDRYATKEQNWNEERAILEDELEKCKFELKEKDLCIEEHEEQGVKHKRCIQKKDEQFRNVIKTLKDLGDKFKTEESRNKILQAKCKNYKATLARYRETSKLSEKKAADDSATLKANEEKFAKIEKIVGLLEPRVGALVSFASNLVDLESRGILTLTAFTPEYRNNLADTVDKCREFWEMLAMALAEDWDEESKHEADKLRNSKLGQMQAELIETPRPSGNPEESASDSSLKTSVKAEMVSKSIQCDPEIDEAAAVEINVLQAEKQQLEESRNLLETEKTKFQEDKNNLDLERVQLEDTKDRLVSEKAMLYARVATLEANLSALKGLSYPLQIDNLEKQIEERKAEKRKLERKLQNEKTRINLFESENRKLFDRLQAAEHALKKLHKEHARMVFEMDKVKGMCPIPEEFERMLNERCLNKENRQDSSPDLGIESGHDALSTISSSKQIPSYSKSCDEVKILKQHNKELSSKLKHTKLTLDKTIEKLEKASLEKELRDRAVCRTLHQTHSLLRVAKSDIILEERETSNDL